MVNISGTNVTIMVKDIDTSISFYESIGLTVQNRWENHYAMIGTTGITIGIHPAGDKTNLNSGSVSIGLCWIKLKTLKICLRRIISHIKMRMTESQAYMCILKIPTEQFYISLSQNGTKI